ncbi:hypothetical protein HOT75_gp114 [Gordonia phage Daredevil]|uniref:Uncharacterized protein n=1 Tax=Gordonia phage Daredevil TaxID=2283286 RepID=A0A345MIX0_9CAUD|nr:hypothetical protein HOT75_gp114 [Gordonia phage Daredevil]AXH70501.1 hypothetical protein SEA_DAREDEVIL_114 [Gordonia phage Daredevil]
MSAPLAPLAGVTTTSALAITLLMRLEPLGVILSRAEAEMLAHAIEFDFDVDFKHPDYRQGASGDVPDILA